MMLKFLFCCGLASQYPSIYEDNDPEDIMIELPPVVFEEVIIKPKNSFYHSKMLMPTRSLPINITKVSSSHIKDPEIKFSCMSTKK